MAAPCLLFILFCSGILVNCDINTESVSNSFDNHQAEILAVLNHLNSTPVKVYNYKEGTLIDAHSKADITELTLDVSVDCVNDYPELPCTEKILICNAFVKNTEGGSRVLNDVKCMPKPEIIIEEAPYVSSTEEPTTNGQINEIKTIALSNEAVSSEVGEHFVAVRKNSVPCTGCPFDLNPNAEGVDELINIALKHLETEKDKKQALIKVLRLQQQVVSGVKLILTAEIAQTPCLKETKQGPCPPDSESTICEITFLHKPWISRVKHVIKNNCTISQEFVNPKDDLNNEIDINAGRIKSAFVDNPNFDNMAENGAAEDMSPARLEDLESQIIVETDDDVAVVVNQPRHQVAATAQSEILRNQPLEDRPSTEESTFSSFSTENYVETTTPLEEISTTSTTTTLSSSEEENNSKSKRSNSEESREEVEKPRRKRAIPQLEKISPDEKGLVKNLADFAAASLDSIDDDNHKRIILQILGAKKMIGDDGVYYRLIMRMGISECLEDRPPEPSVNCREKLFENYTKICKVQVYVNDDLASPKVVKSQCQNIKRDKDNNSNRTNYSRFRRGTMPGGITEIDKNNDKVQELVSQGIGHLNSQLQKNYKSLEVLSASSQVVAGSLYRMKVKLSENSPTICDFEVWEKSWENFKQFTVKCENGDKLLDYKPNSSPRSKRSSERGHITGGITEIDKNNDKVKELVTQSVGHLNSQLQKNYKHVETLSASTQVVAGALYRMKVKLSEQSPTICDIQVWEKPWMNFIQFTVKCENGDVLLKYNPNTNSRKKRSLGDASELNSFATRNVGAEFEVPEEDEFVAKYLEGALTHMDLDTDHLNKLKINKIISVSKQIVAGHIYRIKAQVVTSDCKKTTRGRDKCGVLEGAVPNICDFVIYEQLWVPNSRQTNVTCENSDKIYTYREGDRQKRSENVVVGGESEINKDNEDLLKFVEAALDHLDSESSHENKLKLEEIISATHQVVAGRIYRIKAKVVLSDCKKNMTGSRDQCKKLDGEESHTCTFQILERLWLANSREINVTCDNEEKKHFFRNKRSVLGDGDEVHIHYIMFNEFIKKHNKIYPSKKEYKYRLKVFSDNMKYVQMLNTYEQGTAIYGVTKFADLTRHEFSKSLGLRPDLKSDDNNEAPFAQATIPDLDLPKEFDWRQKGVVTEVKNQQQCGSCWAFSVTGNVEGQYAIKHGKLMEFSEQELVDCDTEDQGCNGGLMDTAYRQIEKLGGLETEQDYPYDAEDEKCHFNKSMARVQLTGALNISHNETDMAKWLVGNGPISIAINANAMQFYMGGVSHPFKFLCNPKNLDHGVLIVGYGVHTYPLFNKTLPYWIVKNSWGKSWGEQGYYRVYRGDGTCGLNQTPSSAIVA